MRTFVLAACCAALGLFVWSCSGDSTSAATSSGTTGTGTTASSTGSTSSGAGGGSARAVIDMFCHAVADAGCMADYACCMDPKWQFPQDFTGIDGCKKTIVDSGFPYTFCHDTFGAKSALEAFLQAGTVIFDQAQFDTCLSLLKSMSAGGPACVQPPMNIVTTTCISAFRGQIAPGEACPAWSWTNAVVFCKDGNCDKGVCVPFLKPGDVCSFPPDADPATQCNWTKGEWCYGDPGPNGPWGGIDGGVAMGVCAPPGEIGDACHPTNELECKSHNCDKATSKCVLPDPQSSACDMIY